jgi:hypothetical protein
MRLYAAALTIALSTTATQQRDSQLQMVLDRAADYVATYEDRELGNVLTSENYVQRAFRSVGGLGISLPAGQRVTDSDFLIVLVGDDRIGVRKVNRVDGKAVTSAAGNLEAILDDSPDGIRNRIAAFNRESSQYNIGPTFGQFNLPTFALRVLRRSEAARVSFTRRGEDKINGIQTMEIEFKELRGPSLVRTPEGESILSSGRIWIEPTTGRVLKTELRVENRAAKTNGRVTVTYVQNKTLGILVPEELEEHYQGTQAFVDCKAKYSNFRSFRVDVKAEIPK